MMDILIKNATIITQNAKRETLKGDILVRDGVIAEVAKGIAGKAEFVLDGRGKLALPGLVNMHTHVAMTLLRGYGEGLPLRRWLREKIWPTEEKETAADAHAAAQLAMLEMIRGGTTAMAEMCRMGVPEIARAAREAGIRAHISLGLFDLLPGRALEGELRAMEKSIGEPDRLVQYGVAPHSPYMCSEELLRGAARFAGKRKLRLHIHVSETREEVLGIMRDKKVSPYEYLDKAGVLGGNAIAAHGSWVSKKEIALAGKRKISLVHTPASNLKLATGGICPVVEYGSAGANVCMGTDGAASNNSLDMFAEMKLTALLQKHRYWKADALPPARALDFATINGARALGIDSGRIEKGALADIVLLERGPNLTPCNDPVSNIVYAANPSNVTDVIIDGKLVMEGRRIRTLDEAAVLQRAEDAAREMRRR